jgi:hypothetical protein
VSAARGRLRAYTPFLVTLALLAAMYAVARPPTESPAEAASLASAYRFTPLSVAIPGGYPQQSIRRVNQDYQHIQAWISALGAGVAMNDLDGDGLPNDLCLVDPRIDRAVVTPVPGRGADRYAPFVVDTSPLPVDRTTVPSSCVPADLNEDGRMDLLILYEGRTPIVLLSRTGVTRLSPRSYVARELVPPARPGRRYTGPQWNTGTAAAVADFDGDGHEDLYLGAYWPDGPVFDDSASTGVVMNRSMSDARNGGTDHVLRWIGGTGGAEPTVRYREVPDALPPDVSAGWALASAARDLDGDLLPELYIGQDFGRDSLLYNRSTPGHIRFARVEGLRHPMVPKSKRLGGDSFKGMGVDFGDLDGDAVPDIFVSNITESWGLEESNFAFLSTAADTADLHSALRRGVAPWEDRSTQRGLAWSGWGWDVKMGDFNNCGDLAIVQATGFVRGKHNRWPQMHELAIANDGLLEHTGWWPHLRQGDDLAGGDTLAFFVKGPGGRYVNVSRQLGLAVPVPTRGVATGDADGDGRLDFAVARQWDEPVFYRNDSPPQGSALDLGLVHAGTPYPGSPAVGAQVEITTPAGRRFIGAVDGGGGHTGKRSNEVFTGLGPGVDGPVDVRLRWRDRAGQVHEQDLRLTPGRHRLALGTEAQEVAW